MNFVSLPNLNDISSTGRLGNQMFQLATAISYALTNNINVHFPQWKYDEFLRNKLGGSQPLPADLYIEQGFHYSSIPYDNKSIQLSGYFQSWKYFNKHSEIIKRIFYPNINIDKIDKVSIHVRRGDYVNLTDHHPLLPLEYYKEAIELLNDRFLIFSDDIEWCKKNFKVDADISFFEGDYNEFYTLHHMASCKAHIIANSSYSWWAAYLSGNDTIAPLVKYPWFGRAYSHYDMNDLLLPEWIIL